MTKKRIVFVINNFSIGGVEQLLLDLLTHLTSVYEVHVVTILGSGPLEVKFNMIGVEVHHGEPEHFADRAFPFKLFWLIVAPITLGRVVRILKKLEPDIVVTSLYQADILGILGAYFAGISKRIIIQHDIAEFGFFRKYFKLFFALWPATDIVANSNTTKKFLQSYWHINQKKITVIHNGIDREIFEGARKPLGEGEVVLGVVGRLEPVKGHKILFEALKILKEKEHIEPRVYIVGGGSLQRGLEEFKYTNGLDKIDFTGPTNNVPEMLKRIDILIVPSLAEGFGLVALEGLVARKIIVASDIAAFRELIESSVTGILFETGNATELAQNLKELLLTPRLLYRYRDSVEEWMNRNGYEYDMKNVALEYEKLFLK